MNVEKEVWGVHSLDALQEGEVGVEAVNRLAKNKNQLYLG